MEVVAKRGRAKKPAQSSPAKKKRSGTPVRGRRRKSVTDLNIEVLGDDESENEWSPRKPRSPARRIDRARNSKSPEKTTSTEIELYKSQEDVSMYDAPGIETTNDEETAELRQIDLNRVSVRPRSCSTRQRALPKPVDLQQEDNESSPRIRRRSKPVGLPTPSPTPSAAGDHDKEKLDEGDGEGFDTVLESEGFTMIDLDSIPSAQRFRSSPDAKGPDVNDVSRDNSEPTRRVRGSPSIPREDLSQGDQIKYPSSKRVSAIPARLLTPEGDETDLSSNVASSPPFTTLYLALPEPEPRSDFFRKVTPEIYSSPRLPSPPRRRREENSPEECAVPPRRVVHAGKALQGAVSSPKTYVAERQHTPSSTHEDFLEGFSSGTKRELRAGLRFGEELAKSRSPLRPVHQEKPQVSLVAQSREGSGRSDGQLTARGSSRQHDTQVWRGEAVVQHSPALLDSSAKVQAQSGQPDKPRRVSGWHEGGWATKDVDDVPEAPSKDTYQPHPAFHSPHHVEAAWQKDREVVAASAKAAASGGVIVVDSSSLDEIQPLAASFHSYRDNRASNGSSTEEEASKKKGAFSAESRDRNNRESSKVSSVERPGSRRTRARATDLHKEDVLKKLPGDEYEDQRQAEDDEATDIWLDEAKESSSSPREEQRAIEYPEVIGRKPQITASKPRRSLIPSPWKRGEIGDGSTMLTEGDMSGMMWQQPQDHKFGATRLARQTKRISSGDFNVNRMLSSPVKLATTGRRNLHLRHIDSDSSSSPEIPTVAEEESDESYGDKSDHGLQTFQYEESPSELLSPIEDDNVHHRSQAETSEELSDDDIAPCEEVSSMASSPPPPVKIPVNFNDTTVSIDESTPPALTRSSPTDEDDARPPTPRSAMKGGRISAGLEEPGSSPTKRVVFNQRSRYLNDVGEESTMSANFDSPPCAPAVTSVAPTDVAVPGPPIENTPEPKAKSTSWGSWLWRGKADQSSSELTAESSSPVADRVVETSPPTKQPESAWKATQTSIPSTHLAPKLITQLGTTYRTTAPKPPSYLLAPSYPSIPYRAVSMPMKTSGDFTNDHFRTLHIIHAKSLRSGFHAPKYIRPEITGLHGFRMTVDETAAGLDVFEWTVGVAECEVLERFCQEVEWGWVGRWHGSEGDARNNLAKLAVEDVEDIRAQIAQQGAPRDALAHVGRKGWWDEREREGQDVWRREMSKVGWGWGYEELARHLGMLVVGEVVREEERLRREEEVVAP